MKILTVFGTRPEAVKLAPVLHELRRRREQGSALQSLVCVTGQHRDMLDQVLQLFGIVPDWDLDVMQHDQSPTAVASAVLARMEPILLKERPDWVVIQGDTISVATVALAAFLNRLRVAHVEAGLRTRDKWQPFPEEINRRVASVISDLHFAPTERARQNLLGEGVAAERILVTGNTVIDALQWVVAQPPNAQAMELLARAQLNQGPGSPKLILVTAHRRENFGEPLRNICQALKDVVEHFHGAVRIIYPVHLNPNVWDVAQELLRDHRWIILTEPLDYLTLVHLMKSASVILTDSGGIQEEAPSLGKPVLVLRTVTERPEAAALGAAKVIGTERRRIFSETVSLFENQSEYDRMSKVLNPYGDGLASRRIVAALLGEPVDPFAPGG